MSKIYNINYLKLEYNCTNITETKWDELMKGSVKANGSKIKKLIKEFIPELYEGLMLGFRNPYEDQSKRTKTHFIYVWSGIEYFLKFEI